MAENTDVTLGGASGAAATETSNQKGQENKTEPKTYTEQEFTAEVDRRVTEAVKTAQGKWQAEYEKKLQTEKDEAARLAKMTADERAKAEFDKERAQFDTERTAYEREKLEYECAKQLASQNLDVSFAAMLTGTDAETTKTNIDAFKAAFDKAVEASVTEKLKGNAPKLPTGGGDDLFLASMRKGAGLK